MAHHAPLTPGFKFWLDSWHMHFNVKIPQKRQWRFCRVLLPQEVPSTVKSLQKNIIPQGPELYLLKVPSLSPAALSAAPARWVRPAGLSSPPAVLHLLSPISPSRFRTQDPHSYFRGNQTFFRVWPLPWPLLYSRLFVSLVISLFFSSPFDCFFQDEVFRWCLSFRSVFL